MHPILFNLRGVTVTSFGVMLALAFLVGLYFMRREMAKRGMDPDIAYDLVLAVAVGALVGARLFFVVAHWADYYAKAPGDILAIWKGGLIFYGGLLGGGIAMYVMGRVRNLNVIQLADCVAAPLAIGTAIGRVGCFLNGCCYGIASNSPLALHFVGNGYAGRYLPTQLVEMLWALAMFGIIYGWLERGKSFRKDGSIFLVYILLYSVGRFFIEFARFATWHLFGIFTFAQLISVALFAVALFLLIRRRQTHSL